MRQETVSIMKKLINSLYEENNSSSIEEIIDLLDNYPGFIRLPKIGGEYLAQWVDTKSTDSSHGVSHYKLYNTELQRRSMGGPGKYLYSVLQSSPSIISINKGLDYIKERIEKRRKDYPIRDEQWAIDYANDYKLAAEKKELEKEEDYFINIIFQRILNQPHINSDRIKDKLKDDVRNLVKNYNNSPELLNEICRFIYLNIRNK